MTTRPSGPAPARPQDRSRSQRGELPVEAIRLLEVRRVTDAVEAAAVAQRLAPR